MNKILSKKLGEVVKAAREKQKLTQAEVAKGSGVAVNYYAMVERGESNLTQDKISRIFRFLKLKPSDIPI